MDNTQEWINFLRSSAEDLEKGLPRPKQYLFPLAPVLLSGLASVAAWLGGWLGCLEQWWEKLLGGMLIAIIIVVIAAVLVYYYGKFLVKKLDSLRVKEDTIKKKKKDVLMLIEMILGNRIISPEEIYNEWQKCKKNESFEERKEEIESAFKIRNSPENVSLEDVKRGFKQLDEANQEKYMKYLCNRKDHNVKIEEWLTENYKELSERVCIEEMRKD